jgi:hypothetical protein
MELACHEGRHKRVLELIGSQVSSFAGPGFLVIRIWFICASCGHLGTSNGVVADPVRACPVVKLNGLLRWEMEPNMMAPNYLNSTSK